MRWALLLTTVALTGCPHQETDDEAFRRMTGHSMYETPPPSPRPAPRPRAAKVEVEANAPEPKPPEETPEERCARTRGARVSQAKEAITTFRTRMQELAPLIKFAMAHHCALKDTTGSVIVKHTKEAKGTRISVEHGHADEIVCDTAKIPTGLDVETLRYIELLDSTDEDEIMFSTFPECDDKEKPSLRVRYNDASGQKAILSLP